MEEEAWDTNKRRISKSETFKGRKTFPFFIVENLVLTLFEENYIFLLLLAKWRNRRHIPQKEGNRRGGNRRQRRMAKQRRAMQFAMFFKAFKVYDQTLGCL
jgi:hypothetical protein